MKENILNNINNPHSLEALYRENKTTFKREFNTLFPEIKENPTAIVWNERLNYESDSISWGIRGELLFIIIASFLAGIIAKTYYFLNWEPELFFQRNVGFVVFPLLAAYFIWKQKLEPKKIIAIAIMVVVPLVYINLLPANPKSDTLILAGIHLPLFLWTVLGFAFVGDRFKDFRRRIDFLKFNGELVVMTTIIVISGGLLTAVSGGLFSLIEIDIEFFFVEFVLVWGLPSAIIFGTFLVQTNPQLVNKVSPIIAKIFTPLVLFVLVIYLTAIIFSGKNPYNDREFLMLFNLLLIGVMAIIFFFVAENTKDSGRNFNTIMLFSLSIVTIIINGIALSAIAFRISEWGITPNRLAVLGANLLILTHLLFVSYELFKGVRRNQSLENVEKAISFFLPIYSLWTIIVVFIFPVLFGFA
ncbi:MAG: DUF4153 domain-containing protein [Bacteroidetes bacterium]|nr:DUF4153 domain-containing protein [Bacteroidota bacterium]